MLLHGELVGRVAQLTPASPPVVSGRTRSGQLLGLNLPGRFLRQVWGACQEARA